MNLIIEENFKRTIKQAFENPYFANMLPNTINTIMSRYHSGSYHLSEYNIYIHGFAPVITISFYLKLRKSRII